MSTRPKLMERVMDEVVYYGGIPLRRRDVFRHATEKCGLKASRFGADFAAMTPKALTDVEPYTFEEFCELENSFNH